MENYASFKELGHVIHRLRWCQGAETIDKNVYLEILKDHLLPWATEHYENGHWMLQQEGAPAHLAKSTRTGA
ncbi:hypothetical protein ANCDUO_02367 [Ancylostoma duodenale]|uniref:Uncharacterized protein n=1 Tax=Ancylostoma duodenale TaxID=51022 RepID=A0A0C2H0L8_9BILA|nr:hypothetical protein ANCDUO_02367 [Ancylostoma duodenale]